MQLNQQKCTFRTICRNILNDAWTGKQSIKAKTENAADEKTNLSASIKAIQWV
jgi:hypothetical protein